MRETNLFHWATSELSQDAFICWLLNWADRGNASKKPDLHRAGLSFLNALLKSTGQKPVSSERIVVHKQLRFADIVAEIGTDRVLLIEDKVHSSEHGIQLDQYLVAIHARFPGRTILPVFFKTGDQSDYKRARDAGYAPFLRRDFLHVLREIRDRPFANDIFDDFLELLEFRETATRSYLHSQIRNWTREAWKGFFLNLQEEIPEVQWKDVSNPRGGFLAASWHWNPLPVEWDTYLQIEEKKLVMKLGCWKTVHPREVRAMNRDQWFEKLSSASKGTRIEIRRLARRGNGSSMTAAQIGTEYSWLQRDDDGRLDFDATVVFLREAMAVLDKARVEPRSLSPASRLYHL